MDQFLVASVMWITGLINGSNHIPEDVLARAKEQVELLKKNICLTSQALGNVKKMAECEHKDFYSYQHLPLRMVERMKFDWDDYLFMAHSGHSSVLVSLAEEHKLESIDSSELLIAVVIGNELAARLGAASFIGHQNGQAWTFPHQLSTIGVLAYLNKWSKEKILKILRLSLSSPHFALYPGFFSFAKSSMAYFPVMSALNAVKIEPLIENGSANDLISGNEGLLHHFTVRPLTFFLSGLGHTWLTRSLKNKEIPGCAYVIGPTLQMMNYQKEHSLSIEKIKKIKIKTHIFAFSVENKMRKFIKNEKLKALEVNFSVPLTLATYLVNGKFSVHELLSESLAKNEKQIRSLASKIEVIHDWNKTAHLVRGVNQAVKLKAVFSDFKYGDYKKFIGKLKSESHDSKVMDALLSREFRKLMGEIISEEVKDGYSFKDADFSKFKWNLKSEIEIELVDGGKIQVN